jgi:hypothetical protein
MENEYFLGPLHFEIVDKYFPYYSCKREAEQNMRIAAKNVTAKYLDYSSYYNGKYSAPDLLKLVAFHFSLELLEDKQLEDMTPFVGKIKQLNADLDQYLQKF